MGRIAGLCCFPRLHPHTFQTKISICLFCDPRPVVNMVIGIMLSIYRMKNLYVDFSGHRPHCRSGFVFMRA